MQLYKATSRRLKSQTAVPSAPRAIARCALCVPVGEAVKSPARKVGQALAASVRWTTGW
jgi:hypothetical protein